LKGVLHFEQVGEVGSHLHADGQIERLVVVIEDGELLVEAVRRARG
jgi:hypothetical protein